MKHPTVSHCFKKFPSTETPLSYLIKKFRNLILSSRSKTRLDVTFQWREETCRGMIWGSKKASLFHRSSAWSNCRFESSMYAAWFDTTTGSLMLSYICRDITWRGSLTPGVEAWLQCILEAIGKCHNWPMWWVVAGRVSQKGTTNAWVDEKAWELCQGTVELSLAINIQPRWQSYWPNLS